MKRTGRQLQAQQTFLGQSSDAAPIAASNAPKIIQYLTFVGVLLLLALGLGTILGVYRSHPKPPVVCNPQTGIPDVSQYFSSLLPSYHMSHERQFPMCENTASNEALAQYFFLTRQNNING